MIALLLWKCLQSFKSFWVFHFHSLSLGDDQVLVLFHFCFCDLHNFHIIFLSPLLLWIFFQMLLNVLYSLFITWWPPRLSSISFLLLWSTQFSYHPLAPSFILEFPSNAFESSVFTFYHSVTIMYNSISCFTFVIYTIFKCAFSYVILVITTNNDNMHWAYWPLASICNFKIVLTI
jgi:hypothetical protein